MNKKLCAGLAMIAAGVTLSFTVSTPAAAAGLETKTPPPPEWQSPKLDQLFSDEATAEQLAEDHQTSLMERQLQQLQLLEEQARRERARTEKLKLLKQRSDS